jgi:hypothetical protein
MPSSVFSFSVQYLDFFFFSSSSCFRLYHHLLDPSIFGSITCSRRQILCKVWSIRYLNFDRSHYSLTNFLSLLCSEMKQPLITLKEIRESLYSSVSARQDRDKLYKFTNIWFPYLIL